MQNILSNGKKSFIQSFGQNEPTKRSKRAKIVFDAESSDDDMVDLSKELHPLSHYVDDEEELVGQLFATINQRKLKSMMPPILREIPPIYLQQLCLHELTGMSNKRILASINGEEMSSSSSDSDEDEEELQIQKTEVKPIVKAAEPTSPIASPADILVENIKKEPILSSIGAKSDLKDECKNETTEKEEGNLTTLDMMALEMRKKLIKGMLEKQLSSERELMSEKFDPEEHVDLNMHDVVIKQEPLSPEKERPVIKSTDPYLGSVRSRRDKSEEKYEDSDLDRSRRRSWSRGKSNSRSLSRSSSESCKRSPKHSSQSCSESSSDDSMDRDKKDDSAKGKKLTKKEFQERMKKAKMNRKYRQRPDYDSFDEEEEERKRQKYKKWKQKVEDKMFKKAAKWEKSYLEGMKKGIKVKQSETEVIGRPSPDIDVNAEEGEIPEVEEGEIESVEEGEDKSEEEQEELQPEEPMEEQEEGACTTSEEEGQQKGSKEEGAIEKITTYHADSHSRKRKKKKSPSPEQINSYPEKKSRKRSRKERGTRHSSKRHRKTRVLEVVESMEEGEVGAGQEDVPPSHPIDSNGGRVEEIDSDENFDDTSKSETATELPCKSVRQSISFSLPKKGLPVSRTDVNQALPTVDDQAKDVSSSEEDFGANVEDCEIELIGESSDETTPSTGPSNTNVLRTASAAGNSTEEVASPYGFKDAPLDSTENSRDANIDIIGVIEPRGEEAGDAQEEDLITGSSWSSRWLQSEKVQTVVTNTKLLSKVRKKIQMRGNKKKTAAVAAPSPQVAVTQPIVRNTNASSVIGSIEEYQKIIGVKLQPNMQGSQLSESLAMMSDDSDDSADDALWSQIFKK